MDLIHIALCYPDLESGFTNPKHVLKLCRKFSRGTQSQKRKFEKFDFSRKSSPKKLYLNYNILPNVALSDSRKLSTQL